MTDSIRAKKAKYEKWFVASSFSNPRVAYDNYGHFPVAMFTDRACKSFWQTFVETGGDSQKAGDEANILGELSSFVMSTPDADRVDIYAEQLLRLYNLCALAERGQEIVALANKEDLDDALSKAEHMSESIQFGGNDAKDIDRVAEEFSVRLDEKFDSVPTGIPPLDKVGKLVKKQASIWASRTSVGKTALIWQISRFVAMKGYGKVLYVSTELSAEDLWARATSGLAKVSWAKIVSGEASDDEINRVKSISRDLTEQFRGRLWVDDSSDTLESIHYSVASIKPDFIVVDHLDEISMPKGVESKNIWLGEAFKYLRKLGKRYNAHVAVVHQLNRSVDERTDHRPTLQDLRWSGDLEQKADAVYMIHREDVYLNEPVKADVVPAELWVRKLRWGKRDVMIRMEFDLQAQFFSPLVR